MAGLEGLNKVSTRRVNLKKVSTGRVKQGQYWGLNYMKVSGEGGRTNSMHAW